MSRNLAIVLLVCLIPNAGLAQSRFNGKWATERVENPQAGTQRKDGTRLELEVDGTTASGTVTIGGLGGQFEVLKDGRVNGNKIQFKTSPSANPQAVTTWTIEMLDDNTVSLRRSTELPIVTSNVLDVINVLAQQRQNQTPVPVAPPAPAARAQTAPISIEGIVEDKSHAFIPGVMVTATNIQTGAVTSTVTNEAGAYSFAGLNPGNYKVSASLSGFQSQTTDLQVNPNTPSRSNFTMEFRGTDPPPCLSNSFGCSLLRRVNR